MSQLRYYENFQHYRLFAYENDSLPYTCLLLPKLNLECKLQAELNTMLFMPVAGGPVSNAGRIKNAQNAVNNVKKIKNEIVDSSKKVEATIVPSKKFEKQGPLPLDKPKNVGLGFTSKINPNTRKLQLSYQGEVIGEIDSLADAQATIKKYNLGKWEGLDNYKSEKPRGCIFFKKPCCRFNANNTIIINILESIYSVIK